MSAPTPDVTIVGAGIAGMTAALELLDAGFSVKVIEASPGIGGKFGARPAKRHYHDFAWHIVADWCVNFWKLVDRIGVSRADAFAPQIWQRAVTNLYLAGDYCCSQIDFVSLEGAIHTGIWAARALSLRERPAGRGTGVVPAPTPPVPFEGAVRAHAEQTGASLGRWAGLAMRRSNLVKAELMALARARDETPRCPVTVDRGDPSASSVITPTASEGGMVMGQVFSTYPGFREPVRNAHTEWLFADEYLDHARRIELPTSRAAVPVPLLFWEVQALCLSGTADVGATEGESLRNSDVRAATNADGRAMIDIWAPNYGGTSVGPLKAVYAVVYLRPRARCRKRHPKTMAHMWWWWYYGNSPTNQEFKRDVWGVPDNVLAAVETSYLPLEVGAGSAVERDRRPHDGRGTQRRIRSSSPTISTATPTSES